MKVVFSILFLIVTLFTCSAQSKSDSSKHLSFKGIPIDGTLAKFVSRMTKNGFSHEGTTNGIAMLRGEFATYKNCIVGVSTMQNKDLVSRIAVIFSSRTTWSSLSLNYLNLKELLTEKYGNPSESVEEFQLDTPEDDGVK